MKNILYLFVALFLFASCDHELENTPDTNKGTGVANFKFHEVSTILPEFYNDFTIEFDLDIVTRDHFTSAPVYVSFNGGEEVELTKVSSTSTTHSVTKASLGKLLGEENLAYRDKYTFSVPYIVLNNTDTLRFETVYTQIEDGKEVEVKVSNQTTNVSNSPIYKQQLDFNLASGKNNIYNGEYTLVATDGTNTFTEDVTITVIEGTIFKVTNLFGGLMREWYTIGPFDVTLNDLGNHAVYENSAFATYRKYFTATDFELDFDDATQVLTLKYSKWGNSATLVYTPKK